MENPEKRIVEIDGVKLEIDLRNAKRIEHYRVGDNVRVLVKSYGSQFKVHPGVIVGFDEFKELPTIVVCYLELGYNTAEVKYAYINSENNIKENGYEIAPADGLQELYFKKSDVVSVMLREIQKKEDELKDLHTKKEYFEQHFARYFEKATA